MTDKTYIWTDGKDLFVMKKSEVPEWPKLLFGHPSAHDQLKDYNAALRDKSVKVTNARISGTGNTIIIEVDGWKTALYKDAKVDTLYPLDDERYEVIYSRNACAIDECWHTERCQHPEVDADGRSKCPATRFATITLREEKKCPKCRTTDFASCHSMYCPMRPEEKKPEDSQDELWREVEFYLGSEPPQTLIEKLKSKYTITKKP